METMSLALAHWGRDGGGSWREGCAGLGNHIFHSTQESRYEQPACKDKESGIVFAVAARVDNRAELIGQLSIDGPISEVSDGEIIRRAYKRWGPDCAGRIYGDWSFAAWHPAERKLFLARDHFGNTALYYYADQHLFAFASDRRALLDLNLTPVTLDELYLAHILTSWPVSDGESTIHTAIKRLPPAHTLAVTCDRMESSQYWFLENTPELHLPRREDYVEAFRTVIDEAVQARLRYPQGYSAGGGHCSPVASTLSGGLDSSAVTATAASMLRREGMRLAAFTSVPLMNTAEYVGRRFGDEWPLAQATARYSGTVDLTPIQSAGITPMQGIRRALVIHNEPGHAAGNQYWMIDLMKTAQEKGHRVMLTGQNGNAAFSWAGSMFSLPLELQIRQLGLRRWLSGRVFRVLPTGIHRALRNLQPDQSEAWVRHSALNPDVAHRLNLRQRRLDDPDTWPARTALEERRWLRPGRSFIGALHAESGAAHGLDIRDPTGDARVLAFSFSVPDRIFRDPANGQGRWLIRAAMEGRLPDEVRLNSQRGRQAGDLVPRLRASTAEVNLALDEMERGPASSYLDVPFMRQVWQMVQTCDTQEAFNKAICVLTRGMAAGLFVNSSLTPENRQHSMNTFGSES